MKNINKFALSLLLSTSLIACSGQKEDSNVLATYNGGKVTLSEVSKHFQKLFDTQPELKDKKFEDLPAAAQESLVRNYILAKLFEKEAKAEGIEDSESFKEKISALKTQLVQQELLEKYVKKLVTEEVIENGYNQLVKNNVGKSEMQASHILVATKAEADDLLQRITVGANFGDLAKQYSLDTGSKEKAGSLGRFVQGQFVPEFEARLATMKKGEVSEPVQTKFGWHIIRLEDKRPYAIPSKEDARQAIINSLNNDAINKLASDLTSKADIKITIEDKKKDEAGKSEDDDKKEAVDTEAAE